MDRRAHRRVCAISHESRAVERSEYPGDRRLFCGRRRIDRRRMSPTASMEGRPSRSVRVPRRRASLYPRRQVHAGSRLVVGQSERRRTRCARVVRFPFRGSRHRSPLDYQSDVAVQQRLGAPFQPVFSARIPAHHVVGDGGAPALPRRLRPHDRGKRPLCVPAQPPAQRRRAHLLGRFLRGTARRSGSPLGLRR